MSKFSNLKKKAKITKNFSRPGIFKIAFQKAPFVSRGDDSGTHKMEKALWAAVGVEPTGGWYQQTGQGMGATLRIASEKQGYTLTDRGSYLALKKTLDLDVVVEGDPALLNIYSVMQVNPSKFPKVNEGGAEAFVNFMLSSEAQSIIKEFGVDKKTLLKNKKSIGGETVIMKSGGGYIDDLL